MKKLSRIMGVVVLMASQMVSAAVIHYSVIPTGQDGRWVYDYKVVNDAAPEIKGFTIWFDSKRASDYMIESTAAVSAGWDVSMLAGVAGKGDGFDAMAKFTGVKSGELMDGFSISFKWIGVEDPAAQPFEVYDSDTFDTMYEGITIPEPSLVLLTSAGSVWMIRRNKN